jgi:hypothetical protein
MVTMTPRSDDDEAAAHAKLSTTAFVCTLATIARLFSRRAGVSTPLRRVWCRLIGALGARTHVALCVPGTAHHLLRTVLPSMWLDMRGHQSSAASELAALAMRPPSFVMIWPPKPRSLACAVGDASNQSRITVRRQLSKLPRMSCLLTFCLLSHVWLHRVKVEPFEVAASLRSMSAEPWLEVLPRGQAGPYDYSHLADVLCLALLYRERGRESNMPRHRHRPDAAAAARAAHGNGIHTQWRVSVEKNYTRGRPQWKVSVEK